MERVFFVFFFIFSHSEQHLLLLENHRTAASRPLLFLHITALSSNNCWLISVPFCSPVQDTLRECRPLDRHCLAYLPFISPVYFVTFVLTAQFVLVNVVVAVLMKHLEDSNKEAQLEEMEERAERREKEEASQRLAAASVGGDSGPNAEAPVQVMGGEKKRKKSHISGRVRGGGENGVMTIMTAAVIMCGRCRLKMRSVPMATC